MNIERHRAFLESLEGENGLPEEMHGYAFSENLEDVGWPHDMTAVGLLELCEYLFERCHRAESRQIPDLKEKVKELVRAYVDAERTRTRSAETQREWNEFRALCEPDKGQDVI